MPEKTIQEAILDTARGPASAASDGHSATAQDIAKQIEADRYLAGQTAAAKNHGGFRFRKVQAPGAG